jgi:broad specificity phosphatase PhoE
VLKTSAFVIQGALLMDLHITRHGQVLPPGSETWERADYPPGDPPLSDLGLDQAHRLGEHLRDMGFSGAILCSPYRRCVQTACQIADATDLTVQPVAPLREIVMREEQMKNFVGMNAAQLNALHERVRAAANFDQQVWWTIGAETDAQVETRVAPLIDAVLAAGKDTLLVGHGASAGNSARYLLRRCAPERAGSGKPAPGWNCALTSFRCTPDVEFVREQNVEHLPEEAITSNAQSRAEVLAAQANQ